MKPISQISKETNCTPSLIRHLVTSNNFASEIHEPKDGRRYKVMRVCNEVEDKIHQILYFTGRLEYLYLESKINSMQ